MDVESMEALYQTYAQTVYRYLFSLCRSADLDEELTQETFYQAIRTIDRFDGTCAVSTWLCAIAKRVLQTHRRKHPDTAELEEQTLTAPSAESAVLGDEDRLAVLRALHGLEEPYREVLYLRLFGDLPYARIGEIFGKTENWARVTFCRGKEKLRKEVLRHG